MKLNRCSLMDFSFMWNAGEGVLDKKKLKETLKLYKSKCSKFRNINLTM